VAAVERGWDVLPIEPEPAMRGLAERALGVAVREGALPDLPLPDGSVDAAAANFVVNHLPDPRAGINGLARVVRPGGRVAVSIWPSGPNALTPLWEHLFAATGARRPDGLRLDPALDFDRSEAGLAALLQAAGLVDVLATTAAFEFTVEPGALWRSVEAGLGVVGTTWLRQTADVQTAMRDAYRAEAARRAQGGVLEFPAVALLAVGRRSAPAHAPRRAASERPSDEAVVVDDTPASRSSPLAIPATSTPSPARSTRCSSRPPSDQEAGGTPVPIVLRRSRTKTAVVSTAQIASTR
jgi:SAM-dependent methyltransferase